MPVPHPTTFAAQVSSKNVLSTLIHSYSAMGIVTVTWVVVGFSLAFGESSFGYIGDPSTYVMLKNVSARVPWALCIFAYDCTSYHVRYVSSRGFS